MARIESPSVIVTRRRRVAPLDREDRTVVWLRGEHDMSSVDQVAEAMAQAVAFDETDLVIDLSGVQFMGAATVGVIERARQVLQLRSRSLSLRAPSSSARRVIDLCGMADLLDSRVLHETAASTSDTAGALGTWVNVPPAARPRRDASGVGYGEPRPTTSAGREGV